MVHQLSLLSLFSLMPFISKKEEAIQRKNTDPPNIAIAPENCSATYLDIPTENHVELLVLIWLISTGYGVVVDQKPLLSGFSLLRFSPLPLKVSLLLVGLFSPHKKPTKKACTSSLFLHDFSLPTLCQLTWYYYSFHTLHVFFTQPRSCITTLETDVN